MLCKIFCRVVATRIPEDFEVFLHQLILQPPKTHVPGFRFFVSHFLLDESLGDFVICLERSWWLGLAHLGKKKADGQCGLSIMKDPMGFCFCRTGDHGAYGATFGENGAVWANSPHKVRMIAQEVITSKTTACFWQD